MTTTQASHLSVYQRAILTELGIVDWVGQNAHLDHALDAKSNTHLGAQNATNASPKQVIEKLRELNQTPAKNQAPQRIVCDFKADNVYATIVKDVLLAVGHSSLAIDFLVDTSQGSESSKLDSGVFAWHIGEQSGIGACSLTTPSPALLLQAQHKKALWRLLQTQHSE
jgi:hypothetical protein